MYASDVPHKDIYPNFCREEAMKQTQGKVGRIDQHPMEAVVGRESKPPLYAAVM